MKIGYARVSTEEQNLNLQLDALKAAGCEEIICDDGVSASQTNRPGLNRAFSLLNTGDTLVVWKMDRAFRSLRHALEILERFDSEGIEFQVLTEGIDTSTAMGKCFYQIRNAFGELESNLISERTKAGMAAAKSRGVHVGRPPKLSRAQLRWARDQHKSRRQTMAKLATGLGVHEDTLRRSLRRMGIKESATD